MSRTIGMTPSSSPWRQNSAESVTTSPVGRACAVSGDVSNWRIGCPAANCCLASRYSLAGRTSVFQLSLAVRLTRVLYFPRQTSFNVCRKACSLYSPSETVPSWPWAATFSQFWDYVRCPALKNSHSFGAKLRHESCSPRGAELRGGDAAISGPDLGGRAPDERPSAFGKQL